MNTNILILALSCIVFGLGGFFLGKRTNDNSQDTKADYLLRKTESMLAGEGAAQNQEAQTKNGKRPLQSTQTSSTRSLEARLAEMEDIARSGNALQRSRAMLAWIDTLELPEFQQAVEHFQSLGLSDPTNGEYNMLLSAWAELDPVAALTHMKESDADQAATDTVLSAWASRDPEAALRWATANHDGEGANPYISGIIRGLAATDPARATAILEDMPFSRERGEALAAMMPHVLQLGPDEAKAWIANLTDEQLRDGAIGRFAEEMAKQNPAETATWLLANLGDTSTRSVDEVYEEWAKIDAPAALSSFEKMAPGEAQRRALSGLVRIQAQSDPVEAAALMNQYPEVRDDGTIRRFIWSTFERNPELAINQVGNMSGERRQVRSYTRLIEIWQRNDAQAANKWLETADLPNKVRENLAD